MAVTMKIVETCKRGVATFEAGEVVDVHEDDAEWLKARGWGHEPSEAEPVRVTRKVAQTLIVHPQHKSKFRRILDILRGK